MRTDLLVAGVSLVSNEVPQQLLLFSHLNTILKNEI